MRTIRSRIAALACCAVALALALPAHAQWKWRDENGQIHYSDQPPPKSVPPARILREREPAPPAAGAAAASAASAPSSSSAASPAPSRPKGFEQANAAAPQRPDSPAGAAANAAGAEARASAPGPKSWEDRAQELRKRDAQRADTERKALLQAEQAAALGRACEMMRTEARTLESGMRVARVNAQGEQEVMSEEERAGRLSAVRRELQSNCPIS